MSEFPTKDSILQSSEQLDIGFKANLLLFIIIRQWGKRASPHRWCYLVTSSPTHKHINTFLYECIGILSPIHSLYHTEK